MLFLGIVFLTAQDSGFQQDTALSIPHSEVIGQLLDFSNDLDTECLLPCFGGIHPDQTTFSTIRALSINLFNGDETVLAQFENPFEREDGLEDYTLRFNNRDISGSFSLSFMFSPEEQVLRRFYARLNHPENWLDFTTLDVSEVLATLGEPGAVYISMTAAQPSYFDIALGYEDLGTLIRYAYFFEPEQLTQDAAPIPLCGSWAKTNSIDVWIQSVDEEFYISLLDENLYLAESEGIDGIVYSAFWPLEQMSGLDKAAFTNLLIDNPAWCFDALSYEELWTAGYSY